MKIKHSITAIFLIIVCCMAGCSYGGNEPGGGKIQIVATLFPQYDFARQIAGNRAEIALLLPPGMESHSYEISPADVIKIEQSDLFIYTGEYMENWAQRVISGLEGNTRVVDVSKGITLDETNHEETGSSLHMHHYDPHIWTDPTMAMIMVRNITDALCQEDPENGAFYRENANDYIERLHELDRDILSAVEEGSRKTIYFGGRYAMHYFSKRYGLTCVSAYDSCSAQTEPSAKAVAEIIDSMKEDGAGVIYYEELTDPKVARSIAADTGAKILLLHSCHNVSKDEFNSGATYLSLMRQNLDRLREGLK